MRKIKKIIITGGVGKGILFRCRSAKTIGRNESRMAELTDSKDYCKMHITAHYLSKLLSPDIPVYAVGKVGDDANGKELASQMIDVGIKTNWLKTSPSSPTMLSVCFQYPDKSGGNLTADNSACGEVTPEFVLDALKNIGVDDNTMVIALPEVPLEARLAMLRYGFIHGAFCVCSNNSFEMPDFAKTDIAESCHMLAMNEEELMSYAGIYLHDDKKDISLAINILLSRYPHLILWITFGAAGSMLVSNKYHVEYPTLHDVNVVNTGGAGDASLAGLITGMILYSSNDSLCEAGQLGMLLGGMSVESPDSINNNICWDSLKQRQQKIRKA